MNKTNYDLDNLNTRIIQCRKCVRLTSYLEKISKEKTKRFKDEIYWGKPLTGFGDIKAQVLLIGLAPAAHGGNRTGRMFTGDSSGDWLAKVLYENGFATKPTSIQIDDGYRLVNAYVTASIRCAPPQNKPTKEELENCLPYLNEELLILKNVKIIICLGRIAFDTCCKLLNISDVRFSHGNVFEHEKWTIICSYHPSRQNTQTGRLTWNQWSKIFSTTREILSKS